MKTETEMHDAIDKATDSAVGNGGTQWPGMSYEDGVKAALEWVLGLSDHHPIDE